MTSNGSIDHGHAVNAMGGPPADLEMQAPDGHDTEGHGLDKNHSRKLKDVSLSLSLQTVRVSLEWRQLNYSIVVKKGKGKSQEGKVTKRILKNLSGTVRAGTFVAIMGPTGRFSGHCLQHRYGFAPHILTCFRHRVFMGFHSGPAKAPRDAETCSFCGSVLIPQ